MCIGTDSRFDGIGEINLNACLERNTLLGKVHQFVGKTSGNESAGRFQSFGCYLEVFAISDDEFIIVVVVDREPWFMIFDGSKVNDKAVP